MSIYIAVLRDRKCHDSILINLTALQRFGRIKRALQSLQSAKTGSCFLRLLVTCWSSDEKSSYFFASDFFLFSLQTAYADFEKTKIAVLDFRVQGNDFGTDDMGKIVAEWLITDFVREGRFEVIERKLLGEVLEEQQMIEAGIVDQETASEIGRLLGVKVIISGSVVKIQEVVEVNARIVDVASASIITAESVSSDDVSSLRGLVSEMARKIIKNFPLEGYVAHRDGSTVVIDLGRKSGVRPGMTFLSFQEGEVVKHPKTGEILYVTKIETGILRITTVQDKIAIGTIVDEIDGRGIAAGDMIKSSTNETLTKLPRRAEVAAGKVQEPEDDFFAGDAEQNDIESAQPAEPQYSAKGLNDDGTPIETNSPGRIFIKTVPENARVRILNIVPKYTDGIILPAGRYQVEVSSPGYETRVKWYTLGEGEYKNIAIQLEKRSVPHSSSSKYGEYYAMIRSSDPMKVQEGAKALYRHHRDEPEVINMAYKILAVRYNENPKDKYYADGMAYLCNILGVSGQQRFKPLLKKIAKNADNRKLRSYAKKNLGRL